MEIPYEASEVRVDPFENLASAIFPMGEWEDRLMAQVAAYSALFDASGHPSDQPFVVVSGFIANAAQWQFFNGMWKDIHDRFKVPPPFHAADFHARQAPYDIWGYDDPQADRFVGQLTTAVQVYMLFGVSCIVDMGDYRLMSEAFQIEQMVPAFALGARACVALVEQWKKFSTIRQPVECIFEDGDFGRGKFMDIMRVERMPAPIFKDKNDFAGLQAADHIAWEQGNYLKRQEKNPNEPIAKNLNMLLAVPHTHQRTTVEQLLTICEAKGIKVKGKIVKPRIIHP